MKKLIERKVDINALNPETGTSPLMLAAALGYHNMCNILIDSGAEINASDHNGNTPLHLAAQGYGDQLPILETLMQHGADVNKTNEEGFTAAMIAKRMENDACFKALQSKSEDKTVLPRPAKAEFKEDPKNEEDGCKNNKDYSKDEWKHEYKDEDKNKQKDEGKDDIVDNLVSLI